MSKIEKLVRVFSGASIIYFYPSFLFFAVLIEEYILIGELTELFFAQAIVVGSYNGECLIGTVRKYFILYRRFHLGK